MEVGRETAQVAGDVIMCFSEQELASMAYYQEHYDVVFDQPLLAKGTIALADHLSPADRRCRFCSRGTPESTFRKKAHAVPEFLGNKALVSMNECDECNAWLADAYEDHLSKWFGPMRTVSQMHGKNGVPTYKADNVRIEMGPDGLRFEVVSADLLQVLDKPGPLAFSLPVDTPSQPHVPLRAAMALVKIACSVCPPADLPQCQPAIEWLRDPTKATVQGFPVLYAFTPGPNPYKVGKVLVLRRKADEATPYLWCLVATANHRFQFFLPFCPKDTWIESGKQVSFTCRHFPVPFGQDWPHGKSQYHAFDWSGTEPVIKKPEVMMHIDRAERVEKGKHGEE